jgi:Na+-transporting NADH:ubiquinone oxidoreductase subunit NqrB
VLSAVGHKKGNHHHMKNCLDPRYFQIATLCILLVLLVFWRQQSWDAGIFAFILAVGLGAQAFGSRWAQLQYFDSKSALISCLSLMLLLKTNSFLWAGVIAAITILSKFFLRAHNRHLFNPTNFGLALALLCTDQVWLSHGQWGHGPFWVLFACCTGTYILFLAKRSDITVAFLGFWCAFIFGRALYLGDPMAIPMHSIQNGALLIFAFFMISDPKTTPDTRAGRILFAGMVALGAYIVQYHFYEPNGLIYALAFLSPLTLIINRLLPGRPYNWPKPRWPTPSFAPSTANAGASS